MVRTTQTGPISTAERVALLDDLPWLLKAVAGHGPIGFAAGDANLYRYVGNSPTNRVDPSGLKDYKIGTDDPKIAHDAGAGVWNSAGGFFGDGWAIAKKQAIYTVLPLFEHTMGPNAVAHMNHFLGNSGADYTIPLSQMVNDVPSAKRLYERELALAQAFTQTLGPGEHNITSGSASNGYNRKAESADWYFAVGGYSAWGKGKVTVSECGNCPPGQRQYTMDFEYKFEDKYNWDGGKAVTIGGVLISDSILAHMHLHGVAQEFIMKGSFTTSVTWCGNAGTVPQIPDEGGRRDDNRRGDARREDRRR